MNGQPLTGASLFAGIGGFDLAMERCGVDVRAAVEIDPDCRGVLARHFPCTRLFGDVTKVTANDILTTGFVPWRGILAGGFPCQDLSIAGRRTGLGGARSGLFWEIVRLANELRPRWLILENVPGLLSSVCSCPGDDTCVVNKRAVQCGRWYKPDGRSGSRIWLAHVPHGANDGACPDGCMERHGGAMGTVLGALGNVGYGFAYRVLDSQFFGVPQRRERVFIVGCLGDWAAPVEVLLEPESGGGHSAAGGASGTDIAGALGSRVGGGRTTDLDGHGAYVTVGTLGTNGPGGGWRVGADEAAAGQLVATPLLEVNGRCGETASTKEGTGIGDPGGPMFTLQAGKQHGIAVTAATLQGGGRRGHRIDAEGAAGGHLIPFDTVRISHGENRSNPQPGDPFPLQDGRDMAKDQNGAQAVATLGDVAAVRRLTPTECERLQAFPDDWTRWRASPDGALVEQSDSARYRQTGNAVTVTVPEWLVRRVVAAAGRLERAA